MFMWLPKCTITHVIHVLWAIFNSLLKIIQGVTLLCDWSTKLKWTAIHLKYPLHPAIFLELWKNKCDIQGERCKIKGVVIKLECYSRMYFLQDLLVCSIAGYFYKLCCIVSNKSTLKYYTPKCVILYLLFILLYSICISYKLGKVKQIEKQVVTDLAQHSCQIMVQNNQLSK